MRVVGISPLDRDSTATFMEDGQIVFACAEERLSRVKLQDGFPDRAVKLGLERMGWDPATVDVVAHAFFDGDGEAKLIRKAVEKDARANGPGKTAASLRELARQREAGYVVDRTVKIPGTETEADEFMPRNVWLKRAVHDLVARSARLDWMVHRHCFQRWVNTTVADHRARTRQLDAGLAAYGWQGKLRRFNHHDTHAANAFHASGFDEALLITLDGYGSGNCGGVYMGNKAGIRPLHKFAFPNSLGQFYEHVTSGLGFKPNRHEGKIVGLAAYGRPGVLEKTLLERFDCREGDIVLGASMNYLFTRALAGHFAKRDVAAAYQRALEKVTQDTVRYWIQKTGLRKVAMSGSVHANVKLNQRIHEIEGVEAVFVYPNMGDGGCGTGAAMMACPPLFTGKPISDVYLGPDYSDSEIKAALETEDLFFEREGSIENRVAELLSQDFIVGRFNGRMEYGPRALGNRSVLYPAREPEANQWLNHQLGRTEFMPFAPAALASEATRLFKHLKGGEKSAEFMTLTFDCAELMRRTCPAAVHVDGTARPQLVQEATNPSFWKILRRYHERTGIPAVINTSFKMHEEPIVCTPADAIRAFLLGNINYLAIGPCLAPHPRLQECMRSRAREAVPSLARG
ncbi:MAG TPA: carbamoyltransferase C-terminal domain-containing protein [Planctomycetota bacterium]|nr:carbamoyltransferase C-terminal domain-containing protein [Planctomycetota bacterium]